MNKNTSSVMLVVKGVLLAYLLNLLFILIYAAILSLTSVSDSTMPTVIFVINLLGIFISTSITGLKIKENGLKYGAIIGAIYILILYLISSVNGLGLALTSYATATIIFNVLIGMVGGVVGVNLVKN